MSYSYENYISELLFELKLLKSYGNEFQDIFFRIMKSKHKNFRDVKPQGSLGDKKCDGYIYGEGIFYQVYGPEDSSSTETQKNAINKLRGDFIGLKSHTESGFFEEIKEYYFVINTKNSKGLYLMLCEELDKLAEEFPDIEFGCLDTDRLIEFFMDLNDTSKRRILSYFIPPITFESAKFSVLDNIVEYLSENVNRLNFDEKLADPDFYEKIKFNELSPSVSDSLSTANLYVHDLDDYLQNHPTDVLEDTLCNIYKTLYKEAKEKFPDNPNGQFKYILTSSFDAGIVQNNQTLNEYVNNVLIIMSKFFETCDIFEEPKKIG